MSDLSISLEALEQSSSQLPVSSYFDEGLFRSEQQLIFQHGPRYVGHELRVPEVGDFHALAAGRRGPGAGAHARRRRTDLQRLPAPSGGDAARPRPHAAAGGVPAAPLDLRPARPARRCTALRRRSLPEPAQLPGAALERPVVRAQRARRRQRPGDAGRRGAARLQRLRLRPRAPARVRLQLEDLHRGLPRGLPRRPLPPRPGRLRHLRRPAVGIRPPPFGADGGRAEGAAAARVAHLPPLARRRAGLQRRPAAAAGRDLADAVPDGDGRVVPARAGGVARCSRRGRRRR